MAEWSFFVPGVPAPQGSKSQGIGRNGKPYMREDNPRTKPWRTVVVRALQDDHGKPLVVFDSAVWVSLRFVFVRPKSHKPTTLPTSRQLGDVDKLTRNMLDALTQSGVLTDDSYVLRLRDVEKVYGPNPGVHIRIGSAVPNPFAQFIEGLNGEQLEITSPASLASVPREMIKAWEPRLEDVLRAELEGGDAR